MWLACSLRADISGTVRDAESLDPIAGAFVHLRADAAAIGIQKPETAGDVWQAIERLDAIERVKDRAAFYLLERFVAGDVFHVDSLTLEGKVTITWSAPMDRTRWRLAVLQTPVTCAPKCLAS